MRGVFLSCRVLEERVGSAPDRVCELLGVGHGLLPPSIASFAPSVGFWARGKGHALTPQFWPLLERPELCDDNCSADLTWQVRQDGCRRNATDGRAEEESSVVAAHRHHYGHHPYHDLPYEMGSAVYNSSD